MNTQEDISHQVAFLACPNRWTLLPFTHEFEKLGRSALCRGLSSSMPSMVCSHEAEVAFCSPEALLKSPDLELVSPIGEAFSSSCGSAYFVSSEAELTRPYVALRLEALKNVFSKFDFTSVSQMPELIERLYRQVDELPVPPASLVPQVDFFQGNGAFTALAKLVYRLLFGGEAYDIACRMQVDEAARVQWDLRQGNDALTRRSQWHSVIDIVDIWHDLFKMPFVASVLLRSKKSLPAGSKQKLQQVAELAQAKMKVEPSVYLPDIIPNNSQGQAIDLSSLWRHVSYRLGKDHIQSLLLFLHLLQPLQKQALNDAEFRVKMIRWQERGQTQV